MPTIDVIWKSYHKPEAISRGYWDQGILEDTFKRGSFEHHTDFNWIQAQELAIDQPGAIVVINGRLHGADTKAINNDIAKLRWCLLIITGDEEAVFPWPEIKHPLMKMWVQTPRMNFHNDISYKLVNGYRPETHEIITKISQQERIFDYVFMGQVNHERRQQCFDVIKQFEPLYNTYIVGTDAFGKEVVPYPTYLKYLAQSKVVPCPSGIETPDSFRLYEALEAGCIPVVDAFSTNNKTPGFWQFLFGSNPPFPIVNYWDEFPQVLPELLRDYPTNAIKVFAWWQQFKRSLYCRLLDDIKELDI